MSDVGPCPACRTPLSEPSTGYASSYDPGRRYRIAVCPRCGHGETCPRPTPEELVALYSESYGFDAHPLIESEKRWRARHLIRLSRLRAGQFYVDLGCMHGSLLEEAAHLGAGPGLGIEPSVEAAATAARRGLNVRNGDLDSAGQDLAGNVDVLFAQHVLEHVSDPRALLLSATRVLRPGGRLVLALPNFGSRTRVVAGRAWGWYQLPAHLHHFTQSSVSSVFQQVPGLSIESVSLRGGDTLFLAMTALNLLRVPTRGRASAGTTQKALLRLASRALRYHYWWGDEEIVVTATRI